MVIDKKGDLSGRFPRLKRSNYRICSPESNQYNCISWAAGMTDVFCWPNNLSFWPLTCPCEDTEDAFVKFFAMLGYKPCESENQEKGVEKIALYIQGNRVKHAARQLNNGKWTSKLGSSFDIEHELKDLEGDKYGEVVLYLRRPIQAS